VDTVTARAPRKDGAQVGIPNMGIDRMREYSPSWTPGMAGRGGGIEFLVHTPADDRPVPDQAGAGVHRILGSSLGALVSLYAFLRVPSHFGFVGAMSPALWFADGGIFPWVEAAAYVRGRVYLDVGTREGEATLRNARQMRDLLERKGYRRGQDLLWVEDRGGMHNEAAWGRRLRRALPFLLESEGDVA
jgi:glycogen operon protein